MMQMMGGDIFFWFIVPVLILLGVIILMMLQQSISNNEVNEKRKRLTKFAREIADERLATGDISSEEHQEISQRIQDQA